MFGKSGKVVVVLLLHFLLASDASTRARREEDTKNMEFRVKDFIGLVAEHGRRAARHTATTEDGYVLQIFRILPNHSDNSSHCGPPIYLQHGLATSADMFAVLEPDRNIAFLLADAGYDVWVGNLRGSVYNRKHRTLSRKDPKFWNFSMDEYAIKDLPAMIDYILDVTNRSSLSYIGISLGTTISTMLLSNRTDYNTKLNLVVHLAPVTFFTTSNIARKIIPVALGLLEGPSKAFEVLPRNNFAHSLVKSVCLASALLLEVCLFVAETFLGKDREQLDISPGQLLKISRYIPAGASAKVFYHYAQLMKTGEFAYFDHKDNRTNLEYYGQTRVPAYNVTNIVAPMVFFKAMNDPFSTLEDDLTLIRNLPLNRKIYYEIVRWKNFNHIDFIIAKDVKRLVYDRLFEILSDFNKCPSNI